MKLSDLLLMSLGSLFKRKARTILTILGVIVGTVSIVVMISLGIGMKSAMLETFESYGGLTTIDVEMPSRYSDNGTEKSDKELEKMMLSDDLIKQFEQLEHVTAVYPELRTNVTYIYGRYTMDESLIGMSPEAMKKMGMELKAGDYPESGELSIIFGNMVQGDFYDSKRNRYPYYETGEPVDVDFMKDRLFVVFDTDAYYQAKAGSKDENGNTIKAPKKYAIPTAGVVKGGLEDYNSYSFYTYCDIDALKGQLKKMYKNKAIPGQPTKKNGKPFKEIFYTGIKVDVDKMDNVEGVQEQIRNMGYNAYSQAEWIASDMQVLTIIEAVLGGIGAISLFVAAIGITNTMMMSIYERTKEIGIMKVIGCKISDIQALFLIEAGYIGFIGGTIGVLISYAFSIGINWLLISSGAMGEMGMSGAISKIPFWLGPVAIVFATLIAMLAGFFPSLRAMRLSPLAAIRAE